MMLWQRPPPNCNRWRHLLTWLPQLDLPGYQVGVGIFLFLSFFCRVFICSELVARMESWICQSIIQPLSNKSIIASALSFDVSGIGAQDTYLYLVRFGEMTFWVFLFFFLSLSLCLLPSGLGTS